MSQHPVSNVAIDSINPVLDELVRLSRSNIVVFNNDSFSGPAAANIRSLTSDRECSLKSIILTHSNRCEQACPGTHTAFLERLQKKLSAKEQGFTSQASNNILVSIWPSSNEFHDFSKRIISDDEIRELVVVAVCEVGISGKITIDQNHRGVESVAEIISGYRFTTMPGNHNATLVNPKVVTIDGYIESVGEIHTLLENATETKDTLLIVCRGCHDDVLSTVAFNRKRDTLNVHVISTSTSLEGINTIGDMSIVFGSELISSLKGDLISMIKFDNLPKIRSATITHSELVITNERTRKNVQIKVEELRKKRESSDTVDDVKSLLDKRIACLTPNHAIIRLSKFKNKSSIREEIDLFLRTIKSMTSVGLDATKSKLSTFDAAVEHYANACAETILSLSAHIVT